MKNKVINDLACIIPTLGNKCLEFTILKILNGTKVPSEIIISLPRGQNFCLDKFNKKGLHIKFIKVFSKKGQVNQRIAATKHTKKKYILQLDDDLEVSKDCVKNLFNMIKFNNSIKKVFGPFIINPIENNLSLTKNLCKNNRLSSNCGKILNNGVAYPVNKCCLINKINKADWLPGGCVISLKTNMVIKDFYKFTGKAYFEDLFNSMERRKKNINHFVLKNAYVKLSNNHNNTLPVSDIKKYLNIKYTFVKKYYKLNLSFYVSFTKILIGNLFKYYLNIKS